MKLTSQKSYRQSSGLKKPNNGTAVPIPGIGEAQYRLQFAFFSLGAEYNLTDAYI